jgi:predicted ABC-type ATPase
MKLKFITSRWQRPAQAVARVRQRVRMGGHNVPAADIRRRFTRSRHHFANDYLPLATRWTVWDSRSLPAKLLASSNTHDMNFIRTFFKP